MRKGVKELFAGSKYRLTRKRGTFCLVNLITEKMYFLQFSFKEPWLLPKSDIVCNNIKLYGWLFFYVGHKVIV